MLDDFARQGLVDDRAYARAYCVDSLRRKAVGRRWLLAKLLEAGVEGEEALAGIGEVLDPEEEEAQMSRALAGRRFDYSQSSERAKALRFLIGRGFARGSALGAIDTARRDRDGRAGEGEN